MKYVFLVIAIITLIIGHYVKVHRQKQLIEIYEGSDEKVLLRALSFGYIINFILPFKLGDLFRSWYAGRKMKNGFSFSLATVIVDRILDIVFVGFIFLIIYILGFNSKIIWESTIFYGILSVLLILLIVFFLRHNKFIKVSVKKFAGIFNPNIELSILKVAWCLITAFKDIFEKINKKKLFLNTFMMWMFYLCSYSSFALSMRGFGYSTGIVDVVCGFFSKNAIDIPTMNMTQSFNSFYSLLFYLYLILPLIIMVLLSLIPRNVQKSKASVIINKHLELLPHSNAQDKLRFLEAYFSAESREYFKYYLKINRDTCILQDYSAGSNATTMLCTDNNLTFFRKYTFGKDSEKLYEQVEWINRYQKKLPLPKVVNVKHGKGYCSYDMPFVNGAIGFFNYIHSHPINASWKVLKNVLDDLKSNLYSSTEYNSDLKLLKEYIDSKVLNNLKKIENSVYIKSLLKYDYLTINGVKYHNLNYLKKYLNENILMEIFKNDKYCVIHGDLTIENIICMNEPKNKKLYYLIDPNTGNMHESPNLDYAKLLQSLHGNYEFLMNTKSVEVSKNNINYLFTSSQNYKELYEKYKKYLENNFSYEKVRSIYFHEIIHWLRLMPYKLEKNKERSVLFYAGFIIVMNDIINNYGGKIEEISTI